MRLHLTLALVTIVALVLTLGTERRHHFGFAQVEAMAEKRAAKPYVPPPDELPQPLQKLTPEQNAGIFSKETARLWRRKGLPFQIDFYHQLNGNPLPHISPNFFDVDAKGAHLLPYSTAFFNFLNVTVNPPQPLVFNPPLPGNLGYAGFYVRYPGMAIGSNPNSLDGFFSALGSCYFRALAKEQVYGLSARGLAINTSLDDPKKPEEFPIFTDWWLHEPDSTATELVLDALLDSPSVTGAYEFKIRPGSVTSIEVRASLHFRLAVERVGIAPFSSMYLYGENARDHFGDTVHPEKHDSDGMLLNTGKDQWIWRPLGQSNDPNAGPRQGQQLQYYNFADQTPKGFGLLQRDRDFQHYQDLDMKYNARPSAWVTPHGDWGRGAVNLIERPSNDANTDNVVMFWHPDEPIKAGDHRDFSYTIEFYMNDAQRPPLAYSKQCLINCPAPPASASPGSAPAATGTPGGNATVAPGTPAPPASHEAALPAGVGPALPGTPVAKPIPAGTVPVQFLIDFAGNGIENTPSSQPPDLKLSYDPPGTYLRESKVEKNGYDSSWRVTFTIIPFKRDVPTELRCALLHNGKPITETWTYTWHQ
jgi:glucans biosynthesis protein